MKIEVNNNQAFFEIKPGEHVYVTFGAVVVAIGLTPDITSGEMALGVIVPGDYTQSRIDLGKGDYETRFVVTGLAARGET